MSNKEPKADFFDEFNFVDKQGWIDLVLKELKQTDLKPLVSNTYEKIAIQPFYTSEDYKKYAQLHDYQHSFANHNNAVFPPRHWANYEEIDCTDTLKANRLALNALNAGAEGVLINCEGGASIDYSKLLKDIQVPYCHVSLKGKGMDDEKVGDYLDYIKRTFPDHLALINGFFAKDMIANWSNGTLPDGPDFERLSILIKKTAGIPGFKPISIQAHQFHNNGANAIQEVAFILNKIVDYIDKLGEFGITPETVVSNLYVSFSIGNDLFMEISKLRAFRILFDQLTKAYKISALLPGDIPIHCTTSNWTKTVFDLETNLLRNTTEAMAAILGGCNSLHVSPHDALIAAPSSFSKRIARNISNILREEAYLDKVVDPAAGSYYVENLTGKIANNSWELFKMIEEKGGFIASFKLNIIQEEINNIKREKLENISRQKAIIVGTNQYPNLQDKLVPTTDVKTSHETSHEFSYLQSRRASEEIETLRSNTQSILKNFEETPIVTILNLGKNKIQKIRHDFIKTFFNVAGFDTDSIDINPHDLKNPINKGENAKRVLIICGNDEDYIESSIPLVKALKSVNANCMVYLAGKIDQISDQLKMAKLDGHIYLRCDLINTVAAIHQYLLSEEGKEINIS